MTCSDATDRRWPFILVNTSNNCILYERKACTCKLYSDMCVLIPDLGYVTIHMSLLLNEKLAISSILPLQKGGSRTPWYSKYLLSYSIGVLGVSTSLSAILSNDYNTKGLKGLIFKKIWGEEDAFDIQQPPIVWQRRAALRAPWPSANQEEERWCNGFSQHQHQSSGRFLEQARCSSLM